MSGSASLQGELWGARAEDWADVQERGGLPLFETVASGLDVGAGMRLLDAGCGAGLFCALAAEAGASVSGLDAAEALLAIARERVPEGDFRAGDLEQLPWEDGSFDLVTIFNALQFAADPAAALREAGRVVHQEGRIVVAVWGRPEDNDAAALMQALVPLRPEAPVSAAGPFALSEDGTLQRLIESVGLAAGDVHEVPCPWVYPDLDTAVRGFGSAGPAILAERHSGREAVESAIAEALQRFDDGTGRGIYRLENVFRYVVARYP